MQALGRAVDCIGGAVVSATVRNTIEGQAVHETCRACDLESSIASNGCLRGHRGRQVAGPDHPMAVRPSSIHNSNLRVALERSGGEPRLGNLRQESGTGLFD